jgi:Uma2 family endonuclease
MHEDTVHEPVLGAEVLSPTTTNEDRAARWRAYQEIRGLGHYLLARQDAQKVELYTRKEGGWDLTIIQPPAAIDLSALAIALSVEELYEGIDFPGQYA